MSDLSGKKAFKEVENIWSVVGAWPEFIQTMRLALSSDQQTSAGGGFSHLLGLPGLCCLAAGGEAEWAENLTLAWGLYYAAAHLMDSIQDGDQPEAWWQEWKPGVGLNAASGLFFTAASALHKLSEQPISSTARQAIYDDFYSGFLVMCAGQYFDLVQSEPTLEQYWEIMAAKSGAFFSLACRCGARLATDDPEILEAYSQFGMHVGMLVQIKDDLDDIRPVNGKTGYGQRPQLLRSLPYLYALNVLTPPERDLLRRYAKTASRNKRYADKTIQLIDRAGTSLYVTVELIKHVELARQALKRANPNPDADRLLSELLDKLG